MRKINKSFYFPIFFLSLQVVALITVTVYYYRLLPSTVPFFYDHGGNAVAIRPKNLFFSLQLLVFLVVCVVLLLLAGLSLSVLPMRCLQPFVKINNCEDHERTLREFGCKTILWTCVFIAQFLIETYLVNFEMARRKSPEIFYWFWIAVGFFLIEMTGLIIYRCYRHYCFDQQRLRQEEPCPVDSGDLWYQK
ncbi:hypothetical protein K7432_004157 [Basidiobolus ranarum]|uniref:Uncharacterized protein n=1 Tax=Basidiobolus ranarum TaxID=34480 RepID=A0ABR2WYP7_9FUNG